MADLLIRNSGGGASSPCSNKPCRWWSYPEECLWVNPAWHQGSTWPLELQSLHYVAAQGRKLPTEEQGRICMCKRRSIFIRKASSTVIFYYSHFPSYCFKYSLSIKKNTENIISSSTAWKFKFWNFQLQNCAIWSVFSLLYFPITYLKLWHFWDQRHPLMSRILLLPETYPFPSSKLYVVFSTLRDIEVCWIYHWYEQLMCRYRMHLLHWPS